MFNVGDHVMLITKNGTKERTQVLRVLKDNNGYVYQVKSRKNPVSEDRLEPVSDPYGNHLIEFTPDPGFTFDVEMGLAMLFKTGDVVEVDGYAGRRFIVDSYTVLMTGKTTDKIPEIGIEWMLLDETNPDDTKRSIIAYEEDMRKVGGGRRMNNAFGAPIDDDDLFGKSILKKTGDKGCTDEKSRLAQVEKYREMYERANQMITDNMGLYAMFGDEKYKRKADRLKEFRDRIPTRGYQFE